MMVFVPNSPPVPWDLDLPAGACDSAPPPGLELNFSPEISPLHSVSGRARPRTTRSMINTGAKFCGELKGM
jgi:hypothetical protein